MAETKTSVEKNKPLDLCGALKMQQIVTGNNFTNKNIHQL